MKKETKEWLVALSIPLVIFSVAIGVLKGVTTYQNRDKFKVGDCVEEVYENEFNRTVYYYKILKVGKKRYLTNQKTDDSKYYFRNSSADLKSSLNENETVDKKLCIAKVHKWL